MHQGVCYAEVTHAVLCFNNSAALLMAAAWPPLVCMTLGHVLLPSQTSFKAYMRQLGLQYGEGLVGSKLWLLRCDQQAAAAAAAGEAQLGAELWMPAEVAAFHESSGEHEVRMVEGNA